MLPIALAGYFSVKSDDTFYIQQRDEIEEEDCYESHIGEVTLKGRPYKDLGSPTPITNFWGVILLRTYARNKDPTECREQWQDICFPCSFVCQHQCRFLHFCLAIELQKRPVDSCTSAWQ